MKRILIAAICLVLTGSACKGPAPEAPTTPLTAFADSLFQQAIDSSFIAGASVIVHQEGKDLLNRSYGYASLELQAPIPEGASFEIGSVTKQFTAAAILKLASEGALSLDDDFTDYVPFETGGREISIRRLLDHTSGIPGYTEMEEFWNLSISVHPRDSLLRLVETKPFLFEPGELQIYNNTGYFLLGLIVEKASGMDYEAYLDQAFFTPLGMDHTYYCSTEKVVPGKVYGYNYTPEGLQQKPYLVHTWPYAAGSLCSTAEDLLTWLKALHGGKVLGPEAYQLLISPEPLNDGSPLRYAKGLSVFNDFGHRHIGHGGGIHGFLSETRYYPDSDLYVVSLVNTTGPKGAGYFAEELAWQVLDKQDYPAVPFDLDPAPLTGTFRGVVRGRTLQVHFTPTDAGLLVLPEGEKEADTLKPYIGDATWMDGNNSLRFQNGAWRIDQIGGYYVLERVE